MLRYSLFALIIAPAFVFAQAVPIPGTPPQGTPTAKVQPAPAAAAPGALDPKLVIHLRGWESSMRGVEKFAVDATLTKSNLVTKREEKKSGSIWVMKPNFARMNLKRVNAPGEKENPNDFEAFICTGKMLYHYDGSKKIVTEIALGANAAGNNLMLDVMSGMTAQQLVNRFDVKLLKEDINYVYLEVKPRYPDDKSDFETMTLVLCAPTVAGRAYMPRMVQFKKTNGQEVESWDFPDPKVNPQGMKETDFTYQAPPKDWRVERAVAPKASPLPFPGTGQKLPTPGEGK